MSVLSTDLRNQLGRAIISARREAEAGARKALESLAVERHEPHGSMTTEDRLLRNRLRARGRQLGDVRDKIRGTQSIERLTHEVAYEHWHRKLFARFLAENDLLIHPEHGVPISTSDIDELAREAGENPRDVAARFAQDSLPQIFRSGDPVLEVTLAPETRQALDKLLDSLPSEVFTADDSLGWTYQYWQTEKKAAVNVSGNKIGADELPAVTQLFTEHYMVVFLYHNTIGAWHAGKVLAENPGLAESAQSEEELRQAVRLSSHGGYDFEYLRFVREPNKGDDESKPTGHWRPAAGAFKGWPKTAKQLKVLDPCCGSGHFLVEGFELLVRLRMDEEGIELGHAIRGVLTDNLHGLEIDPRCTQIAAFNLAMAAWKMAGKPMELPPLHIACSGLAVGSTRTEWAKLAGHNERLCVGMEQLFDLFEQAPELGSLIDPKMLKGDLLAANFGELKPLLEQVLLQESNDVDDTERAVAAQGMARAAELLSGNYTLAITNVPYLARGKQSHVLRQFADEHYDSAKADLATMFIERMLRSVDVNGTAAVVSPQNWLFLGRYTGIRKHLLMQRTFDLVCRLGAGAFSGIGGWVVNIALLSISATKPRQGSLMTGLDASAAQAAEGKATFIRGEPRNADNNNSDVGAVLTVSQADQLANPDARIGFDLRSHVPLLTRYADTATGIQTYDRSRFIKCFWEVQDFKNIWIRCQSTVSETCDFGGMELALRWESGRGALAELMEGKAKEGYTSGIWRAGSQFWGQDGILVSLMGDLPVSVYGTTAFDKNAGLIVPRMKEHLAAIWAFTHTGALSKAVRSIDQALKVSSDTLAKIPFDVEHWHEVATEQYQGGLPEPQSVDPTQWLFHGHPAKAETDTALQVAVGRLLGYRWPSELDPEMRLAAEAREWIARCDSLEDLADEDGVVCLSATRGERTAADRLRALLAAAFGKDWSASRERELLAVAGGRKKPARTLEVWLRDRFYEAHCKLFHHRPFIWHIWDGNKDGFHCLVNAHKLTGPDGEGRRTLKAITYSYLGDWIDRQKVDQREGKEGADARLASAQDLRSQLERILEGEPPYDLFVRWRSLHEQAIGWDPDINDGVRLNIRPFMRAALRKGGKKGAGILRWKPNVKWKKDRGKEPESLRPKTEFPWFWGCPSDGSLADRTDYVAEGTDFDGNRWNDLHYTNACKKAARERVAKGTAV